MMMDTKTVKTKHMTMRGVTDVPNSVIHIEMGIWQLVSLAIRIVSVIL